MDTEKERDSDIESVYFVAKLNAQIRWKDSTTLLHHHPLLLLFPPKVSDKPPWPDPQKAISISPLDQPRDEAVLCATPAVALFVRWMLLSRETELSVVDYDRIWGDAILESGGNQNNGVCVWRKDNDAEDDGNGIRL